MLSKQKDLQERAVVICEVGFGLDWNSSVYLVDTLFEYLHSQGVVIKVDRELNGCGCELCDEENGVVRTLVEPLIGEGK